MASGKIQPKVVIKISKDEDILDLSLCAKDYIDLIDDFQEKYLNNDFFILAAYYNNVLAGILVAENSSQKIDSIKKIVPRMCLYFLFVNSKFRNKDIGKMLLDTFLKIQKKSGMAIVFIKIPQKYKKGIKFFQQNNFQQMGKERNKIILEINLWNDYGIRDCQIIGDNFDNMSP